MKNLRYCDLFYLEKGSLVQTYDPHGKKIEFSIFLEKKILKRKYYFEFFCVERNSFWKLFGVEKECTSDFGKAF